MSFKKHKIKPGVLSLKFHFQLSWPTAKFNGIKRKRACILNINKIRFLEVVVSILVSQPVCTSTKIFQNSGVQRLPHTDPVKDMLKS